MPAGSNLGNQLNVFLFEVGFIDVTDTVSGGRPFVVGVHPLVIVPTEIVYTDTSRSPVFQTGGGAIKTTSGRALRRVQFRGSFGVETAGLGVYLGTGETRFQRFYKEVVRMGEALSREDTRAATDLLRGTPTLSQLLRPYDPERHVPFINFYDFWNERQFSCTVQSWQDSRFHARGGATGLVHFTMVLQEEGPIVVGGPGSGLIQALFSGLTTWSAINDTIESYTLGGVLDGLATLSDLVIGQFNDSLAAINAQLASATAVVGGFKQPVSAIASTPTTLQTLDQAELLTSFFTNAEATADNGEDLIETASANTRVTINEETGAVDWAGQEGEGGSAALDGAEQIDALEDVVDAARWQAAAGVLFGWNREAYQAYVTGQTDGGRANDVQGSVPYTVRDVDTEAQIEARFGVPWDRVLEVNGLTPDEALFVGRQLQIPVVGARGVQPTIEGPPTFGSHVGQAAWGADLTAGLDVTAQGDFVLLSGEEVLEQGVDWLIETSAESLLLLINEVIPELRPRLIRLQLESTLLTDKRVAGIDDLTVALRPATAIAQIGVTLSAINGGTIQTGGPL